MDGQQDRQTGVPAAAWFVKAAAPEVGTCIQWVMERRKEAAFVRNTHQELGLDDIIGHVFPT